MSFDAQPGPGSDALVRPDASPLADENAGPEASVPRKDLTGASCFGTTTISLGWPRLATPVFVNRRGMARKPRLAPQRLAGASCI